MMRFDGLEVDEEAVAALLADMPALLTESEAAQLRADAAEHAARTANSLEIAVAAAGRKFATPQEVMNAREAIMRHAARLTMELTIEAMNTSITVN